MQLKSKIHGTLVIAAVGNDGIVMVADSRNVIGDKIAYFDSLPKIYTIGRFLVGTTNAFTINDTATIAKSIFDFNKVNDIENDIIKTANDYIEYLNKTYPTECKGILSVNQFIFAGYHDGKHIIGAATPLKKPNFTTVYGVSCSASTSYDFINYDSNDPISVLKEKVKSAFAKYIIFSGREYEIGGPLTVAVIYPGNKIKWIENRFEENIYMTYKQFGNDILSGKIKLSFLKPEMKEEYFSELKKFVDKN